MLGDPQAVALASHEFRLKKVGMAKRSSERHQQARMALRGSSRWNWRCCWLMLRLSARF